MRLGSGRTFRIRIKPARDEPWDHEVASVGVPVGTFRREERGEDQRTQQRTEDGAEQY